MQILRLSIANFKRNIRFYLSYILPLIVLFIFVMGYWNKFHS